jgi:hypothetical protein
MEADFEARVEELARKLACGELVQTREQARPLRL